MLRAEISWQEGGQILEFACAHDLGFRAYLSSLIIADALREQGIGRQFGNSPSTLRNVYLLRVALS